MAKKKIKKYSSSSSRKGKPQVTRKPQRSTGYKKPAVKRKVSTAKPFQGKRPSQKSTANAILREFQKIQRQSPSTKKIITKRPVKKAAKRVYKDKYQENLAKILDKLQKDVSDLKKAKEPERIRHTPGPKKEAFPEDEDFIEIPTTQAEALALIAELRREINQRNIMLDEMMNQPGKQYFTD